MNAREAALKTLHTVLSDSAYSNDALSECFRNAPELSQDDRRFTEFLLRTVLKNQLSLLDVIRRSASVRPEKMKPRIREILLLGSCELLFMHTPDYAVINEYVRMTKKAGFQGLSGFVNAVLRNISENGNAFLAAQEGALHYSLPEELYRDIRDWYPDDADSIFRWFQETGTEGVSIRRNQSRASDEALMNALREEGRAAVPSPFAPDMYLMKNAGDLTKSPAFMKGLFTVQDLSSALSSVIVRDLFAQNRKSFSVLDACASPGGKTLHTADLMEVLMPDAEKEIISCDLSERKIGRIRENAERCGFSFIHPEVRDASVRDESFVRRFDLVILDVPCSGIGVTAKRPEIRMHASGEARRSLCEIQARILEVQTEYVKPGGTLLYSTCTIAPEENLLQVGAFLNRHPEYELTDFSSQLNEAFRGASGPAQGYFQILPGKYGSDGFFMARMTKRVETHD